MDETYLLPSNWREIIENNMIELVDYMIDNDVYMYCEEGIAWNAILKIKGLNYLVYINKCMHMTKHTYTETLKIKIGDKQFVYSHGDYAEEENYNIKVISTLHKVLNIPIKETPKMIYLLFIDDSSFNEDIESLSYYYEGLNEDDYEYINDILEPENYDNDL